MKKSYLKELFKRHPANPIITSTDLPYPANSVFNVGATKFKDDVLLLMRVEGRNGLSHLNIARSKNGVNKWRIESEPIFLPNPNEYPEEIWGVEDPRITWLEEKNCWAIVYTAFSKQGPLISLATTDDFKNIKRHGPIMLPVNKDGALFPTRHNGLWAIIHRPVSSYQMTSAHIWISYSPDLKHWGGHRILIQSRKGSWWDSRKVGLSTPPHRTDSGWLLLYHGVKVSSSGSIYRLGLALLDLENPSKVIARGDDWVFEPEMDYEMVGDVDKVVFPCGWIIEGDDIRLYYGAGDKCLALAKAKLSELLLWLRKHNIYE